MSLYRRKDSKQIYSRIVHAGVEYRQSLGVTNLKDAKKVEDALRLQLALGNYEALKPKPTIPTFEAYCTDFLNFSKGRVARSTLLAYTKAVVSLVSLPELADCPLTEVKAPLADRYVSMRMGQDAIATINTRLRVLRRILHVAYEQEVITKVPVIHELKGENQRDYVISETDEQRLIDAVEHPTMKALIPFLINTGLRIGEACALTWADVTDGVVVVTKSMDDEGRVTEGKTKFARRTVPLTQKAAEILSTLGECSNPAALKLSANALSLSAPVFTRHFGAISPVWATAYFIDARRAIGIPDGVGCVLHSTRHTFLSRLGKVGASPFELRMLAGHSNIQMSAQYCHPDTEQLTSAINRLNKGEK